MIFPKSIPYLSVSIAYYLTNKAFKHLTNTLFPIETNSNIQHQHFRLKVCSISYTCRCTYTCRYIQLYHFSKLPLSVSCLVFVSVLHRQISMSPGYTKIGDLPVSDTYWIPVLFRYTRICTLEVSDYFSFYFYFLNIRYI